LWLHSLKVAQLLRSAACLHTNQSRSYLNHLVQTINYAKITAEWQGCRAYWTGQNTKKYWFAVCCLLSDELSFMKLWLPIKPSCYVLQTFCILFDKLFYWYHSGDREPHVGQPCNTACLHECQKLVQTYVSLSALGCKALGLWLHEREWLVCLSYSRWQLMLRNYQKIKRYLCDDRHCSVVLCLLHLSSS